jgi:hypothetical protein
MERTQHRSWSRRLAITCAAIGLALLVVACGGDSEGRASPATPTPTEAQVIAAAEAVFPGSPGSYGACTELMDAPCPLTRRLWDRLTELRTKICRCQNGSATREIEVEVRPGGAIAHVTMYEGRAIYDLVMILDEDGYLLVDDQTCNGDPKTSIYNDFVLC